MLCVVREASLTSVASSGEFRVRWRDVWRKGRITNHVSEKGVAYRLSPLLFSVPTPRPPPDVKLPWRWGLLCLLYGTRDYPLCDSGRHLVLVRLITPDRKYGC